jgi:hypothetical protein
MSNKTYFVTLKLEASFELETQSETTAVWQAEDLFKNVINEVDIEVVEVFEMEKENE